MFSFTSGNKPALQGHCQTGAFVAARFETGRQFIAIAGSGQFDGLKISAEKVQMDITDEQKQFVEEIARRVRPEMGIIIKTRRGEVVVTQTEKTRLDLIARQEGISTENLINFHSPS